MNTKFDFSKLTLQVIDITMNSTPDIYINQKSITFSKRLLDDMGYPGYVQYCIDPEQGVFAVRVCKGNEAKAVAFSKPRNEQMNSTLTLTNKNIHDVIAKFIPGYTTKKRYKLVGHYDSENKIMYFDIKEATVHMYHKEEPED